MQTSSVQNQGNVTLSSSGAKSQSTPDVPFNQMLNQQIADRSNVNTNSDDAGKTPATSQANESAQPNNASKDAVSKQADASKASDAKASDAKATDKDKTKDTDGTASTDANPAVPASAEMMALIANQLNQAKAGDTAEGKTNPAEGLSLKKAPTLAGIDANAVIDGKDAKKTDTAEPAALTGKETSSKAATNFAATMTSIEQQAAESKQAAAAKLQDTLAAIPNGATQQLQQAAPALTQAAGQITDKLTPAVGSPAWDQALGQKVVWMVAGAQQSASLTLNPPDLGPMQVVLHVSNGHADAAFTASQPEVRQALEAALPKLREMLGDAGIQLGQATISMSMPQQQNRSGDQSSQGSRGGFSQNNESTDTTTRITGTTKIISGQGLVDTFA